MPKKPKHTTKTDNIFTTRGRCDDGHDGLATQNAAQPSNTDAEEPLLTSPTWSGAVVLSALSSSSCESGGIGAVEAKGADHRDSAEEHTTPILTSSTSSSSLAQKDSHSGENEATDLVTDGFVGGVGGGLGNTATASAPPSTLFANVKRNAQNALDGFVELRSKAVGLDMALKSACWTLRLVTAVSEKGARYENAARYQWASALVTAIIDERMMFNQWKWLSTARNTVEAGLKVNTILPLAKSTLFERASWFFTFLTYFLRTFEQGQGDIGFWNRFWFTNWNKTVQSRRYKLFKSLTLTASLVAELLKYSDFRSKLREAEDTCMSPVSVAATPIIRGDVSFDHATGVTDLRQKLRKSMLLIIRNIGDMIIYYQWIEAYKPNKVFCALCGMYSGLVGVYLVWTDNRDAAKKRKKELRLAVANGSVQPPASLLSQ